ncbi:MAG TPA: hypothetical protein VLH94_01280 [Spirochaetia bacterium]|nr:hypothetical protein [Spirochaetia bacterium]
MATLTEASVTARKAIKYGAIGFVGITILWYLGVAGVKYYQLTHPAPLPDPTMDFGVLPKIQFPETKIRPKIVLELPTGGIPSFVDRMWVYSAPIKKSAFSDTEKGIEIAAALGFLFKPDQKTESNYVWTNQDQLNSKLDMNIVSGHFVLTRQWQNNPALASMSSFTSDKAVILDTENYLSRVGLLSSDIVGVEKTSYLKDDGGKLTNALSLSDADFVQLDLFRKNIDEIDPESKTKEIKASYPFYRTDPNKGLLRVVVSGSKNLSDRVINMDYGYNKIVYTEKGTYPIKTGEEAWTELEKGGGYVYQGESVASEVKIRRVFLGYYDPIVSTGYTMPIYIFLGDQGFTAYVSAIRDSVVK